MKEGWPTRTAPLAAGFPNRLLGAFVCAAVLCKLRVTLTICEVRIKCMKWREFPMTAIHHIWALESIGGRTRELKISREFITADAINEVAASYHVSCEK